MYARESWEKIYVSNTYTWKFGVTLLFMISAPEQNVFEGQEYGQLDWPSLTEGEGEALLWRT